MAILWLPLDCALLGIRKTVSWVPVTGLILPGASHDWRQGSEGAKSRKSQHFSKSTCSCGTWPGPAQAYLVISFGFVLFSQVPRACATTLAWILSHPFITCLDVPSGSSLRAPVGMTVAWVRAVWLIGVLLFEGMPMKGPQEVQSYPCSGSCGLPSAGVLPCCPPLPIPVPTGWVPRASRRLRVGMGSGGSLQSAQLPLPWGLFSVSPGHERRGAVGP